MTSLVRIHINCSMLKRHSLTIKYFLKLFIWRTYPATGTEHNIFKLQLFFIFQLPVCFPQGIPEYFRDINKLWNSFWWKLHEHSNWALFMIFFLLQYNTKKNKTCFSIFFSSVVCNDDRTKVQKNSHRKKRYLYMSKTIHGI